MTPSPVLPDDAKAIIASPTATLCGNFKNAVLRLPTLFYEFLNWALTAGGAVSNAFKQQVIPSGMIMPCAHATVPDDWLMCNGQEVSRTDYADLFAAIGIVYGAGNGTTTFNVPDLRAKFIVGVGTFAGGGSAVLGTAAGEDEVTLAADEYGRDHIHVTGRSVSTGNDNTYFIHTDTDMESNQDGIRIVGGGSPTQAALADQTGEYRVTSGAVNLSGDDPDIEPHNNLPPYLPVHYLIKT